MKNYFPRAKSLLKPLAIVLVLAAIICGGVAGYNWYTTPAWPDFAAQTDLTPQAKVVLARDYAYRTADLVKAELFLKQMPATTIEPATLAVSETFELAQKPTVTAKKLKDGSVLYRIDLTLQSFTVAPDLTFTGTVSWKNGDQRSDLKLPETHIFTSNTYDGRKNLQEGADPRVSVYWYTARYVLPLILSSIIFVLLLVPAIRAYLLSRIKPVVIDHARLRVVDLMARISSGSLSQEEHLELDALVRDRFNLGPVPAGQLDQAIVPQSLIEFLKLNEPAIYSQEVLDEQSKSQLLAKGQLVLSRWK